jgi:ABC-type Fe3+ transport system substrate-binding protein
VKEAFEKEYPFLQVEFFRGNAERLVQKMFAEYQAKRYDADIIDGTVSPTMVRRANLLQRFYSPVLADYPAELKDSQGYWGSTNLYFFATGYNTRMVKPNDVPKTYEDLLNPRWKGQMMWSTSRGSGAPIMIGTILNTMGEAGKAYLQKLKAQDIAKSTASNRQILDLTIAGEYPLALTSLIIMLTSVKALELPWIGKRTNRRQRRFRRLRLRKIHRIPTRRCFCSILSCPRRGRRCFSSRTIYRPIQRFRPSKRT